MNVDATFARYWSRQATAADRYTSDTDFRELYAAEVRRLYADAHPASVLDVGCGSGTMCRVLGLDQLDYTGIDYSQSMLDAFLQLSPSVAIKKAELSSFLSGEEYDLIIAINVVQYLPVDLLNQFLSNAAEMLNERGRLILAGVPDKQKRPLVKLHTPTSHRLLGHLLRRSASKAKEVAVRGFAARRGSPDDGIGYWFDADEIDRLAKKNHLTCSITASVAYQYRFHAVLTALPPSDQG